MRAVASVGRGGHRIPAPSVALRGRAAVAAVAAGAVVASGYTLTNLLAGGADVSRTSSGALLPSSNPRPEAKVGQGIGGDQLAGDLLPLDDVDEVVDVQNLIKAASAGDKIARKVPEQVLGKFFRPAVGRFTSGFGGRWGRMHEGIDIANRIGTPILSVTDGVVTESGPVAGYGMWVKVRDNNGFTTLYGHINRSLVNVGQRVTAGQQIAEMGNRGFSTGSHLHFEVSDAAGRKLNPQPWLAARGVRM